MKKVYRVLLFLVTLAVPVVIAACYGPSYRYRGGGRVLDEAVPPAQGEPDGGVESVVPASSPEHPAAIAPALGGR